MEKIVKILPFEVKEVSPRVLEFVGSTESQDREGDIIMAKGWKLANYKKNPVFMWAHNYTDPPVGKAIEVWAKDGQLRFHVQFAERHEYEFADTVYQLYKGGFIRATSVGFIPIKSEPIETKEDEDDNWFSHQPTRYLQQELLELSGCPVPANPEALAEAKAKGIISDIAPFMEVVPTVVLRPYPNEHACRLRDPDDFQEGSFRRSERTHDGKKYSVIMGRLEDEDTMTDQAYRYNKETWTAAEARTHCKDYDGTFEVATEASVADKQSYTCECIVCGHTLETEEHCVDLKCPECGGEMRRVDRPGPGRAISSNDSKAAISYESAHPNGTPKAGTDVEWNAGREVASAEVDDLKVMCTIVQGDTELKGSYKLPHHLASDKHAVVWAGVAAAGAVLMGARGGIDATEAEQTGAKAHLAKHYEEFDKEPPWKALGGIPEKELPREREISQAAIADEMAYLFDAIAKVGLSRHTIEQAWNIIRIIFQQAELMRDAGNDIPVDIAEKIGAVLNRVNRERLEEIKSLAQGVLDSAEHTDEPEKALTREEIRDIITNALSAAIEQAKGKLRR